MRRHRKTYGMVQNVVFRLLFLRLSGARLFPVELSQHQKAVISPVKILKISKKCAVLEWHPPGCVSITWTMLKRGNHTRLLASALHK